MPSQGDFRRDIEQRPLAQDVHILSGEYDVLLKIRATDIDRINRFIVGFVRQEPISDETLKMLPTDSYLELTELRSLGW